MKIKIRNIIFALYMSGVMSFCMSGVITWINLRSLEDAPPFLSSWLTQSFPLSYIVALPIALFVVPLVGKLTNITLSLLFKEPLRDQG